MTDESAPNSAPTLHNLLRRFMYLEQAARQYPPGGAPPQIQNELDALQSQYANLPPHLQRYATTQLNEMKVVDAEANSIQKNMEQQARRLRAGNKELQSRFRDTFGAGEPLNVQQYAKIRNGADKLTLKTKKARFDKDQVLNAFQPHLEKLGLSKHANYKQVVERMDNLLDARRSEDAGQEGRYLSAVQNMRVNLDLQELDDVLNWWDENSFAMAWTEHLAKKDEDIPETEEFTVSDDLRSYVNAASETIEAAMDKAEHRDAFDDAASEFYPETLKAAEHAIRRQREEEDIPQEGSRDPESIKTTTTTRGDIAAAWLRSEAGDSFGARFERGED